MNISKLAFLFFLITNIVNAQTQEIVIEEPIPKFSKAVMQDSAYIESGKQVWDGQCRHCHGNSAYPGKAPKLKPNSYQPEFVYDRVTNGFRKMPGWKTVFNEKQRIGVTVYIMSNTFSP